MKAFISVDLEGMPFVVIREHLHLKGTLYSEAREIATRISLIVAEELHRNGFEEILIADSHGPMVNLLVEDLPEYVELIRGFPRPMSMVSGVAECDVALFLGYHSKFGTAQSTFDHTYSGRTIQSLCINGIPASEFLLNSYAAGDFNVPVILVAGDAQLLEDDVKQFAPWAESVVLKHSLSRTAAKSCSLTKIEGELKEAVVRAIKRFRENAVEPLKAEQPVKVRIVFQSSLFAAVADFLPTIHRVDGLTVEYSASTLTEAYNIFQLLVLATAGI